MIETIKTTGQQDSTHVIQLTDLHLDVTDTQAEVLIVEILTHTSLHMSHDNQNNNSALSTSPRSSILPTPSYPKVTPLPTDKLYSLLTVLTQIVAGDVQPSEDKIACSPAPNTVRFLQVMMHIVRHEPAPDIVLLTGDLAREPSEPLYRFIDVLLQASGIRYYCLAGNHDVTATNSNGDYIAVTTLYPPLIHQLKIITPHWQILLLNSSQAGRVEGHLEPATLAWIHHQLTDCALPTLISCHHAPASINCDWIDAHRLDNAEEFWQTIVVFNQVKAYLCGHVHQETTLYKNGCVVLTTPATCYQFLPRQTHYSLDTTARSGYRWLSLDITGQLLTQVIRVPTN